MPFRCGILNGIYFFGKFDFNLDIDSHNLNVGYLDQNTGISVIMGMETLRGRDHKYFCLIVVFKIYIEFIILRLLDIIISFHFFYTIQLHWLHNLFGFLCFDLFDFQSSFQYGGIVISVYFACRLLYYLIIIYSLFKDYDFLQNNITMATWRKHQNYWWYQ